MEGEDLKSIFPILILNARPAAGKSEVIAYLESVPIPERMERFHIGPIKVFDDFPLLWEWFQEDDILEQSFGLPRLHSTSDHYFLREFAIFFEFFQSAVGMQDVGE